MQIKRENYELYFIDYLDGKLPVELIDDLLDFLRANPDLAEELKEFSYDRLEPHEIDFPSWDHLKKDLPDNISPFESLCIRYIEQEMDEKESVAFLQLVNSSPEKLAELKRFKNTLLVPDETEVFGNAGRLKKKIVPLTISGYAVAAVIVLAIAFWFVLPKIQNHDLYQLQEAKLIIENLQPKQEVPAVLLSKPQFKQIEPSRPTRENTNPDPYKAVLTAKENSDNNSLPIETVALLPIRRPELLNSLPSGEITLEPVAISQLNTKDYSIYRTIPQLLADEVRSIDPKEKTRQASHGFLNFIRQRTDNKFNFEDNEKGKITRIEFNSRMLAFSVPLGDEEE